MALAPVLREENTLAQWLSAFADVATASAALDTGKSMYRDRCVTRIMDILLDIENLTKVPRALKECLEYQRTFAKKSIRRSLPKQSERSHPSPHRSQTPHQSLLATQTAPSLPSPSYHSSKRSKISSISMFSGNRVGSSVFLISASCRSVAAFSQRFMFTAICPAATMPIATASP